MRASNADWNTVLMLTDSVAGASAVAGKAFVTAWVTSAITLMRRLVPFT